VEALWPPVGEYKGRMVARTPGRSSRDSLLPASPVLTGEMVMNLRVSRFFGPLLRLSIRPHVDFICMQTFLIIRGNAIEVLKQLQNKVDCVITSPAYYEQRIYGTTNARQRWLALWKSLSRDLSIG
jgi:hypothetical protein